MSEDLFFHLHPSVDRCLIESQWTISKNPWGRLCGVNDLQGETVKIKEKNNFIEIQEEKKKDKMV